MDDRRSTDGEILAQLAVLAERVQQIDTRTRRVVGLLEGDNEAPGMKTRLDRLEQARNRQSGYHLLWLSATITAAVAWVTDRFGGG